MPIWAGFMKGATQGRQAGMVRRPDNVVGVNVCRLSGKLPNARLRSVQVVNKDGAIETRSMVYTDYFVQGHAADHGVPAARLAVAARPAGGVDFGKDAHTPSIGADEAGSRRRRR